MIDFYRLANATQCIMSASLFYQLIVCTMVTAINLFIFESNSLVSLVCLVSTYQMSSVLIPTFIYCCLSNIVSVNLLSVGDSFYECKWYTWSSKQRQLLVVTIQRSQRKFDFNGFGLIECSLRMFLSVKTCKHYHCMTSMHHVYSNNSFSTLSTFPGCSKCLFVFSSYSRYLILNTIHRPNSKIDADDDYENYRQNTSNTTNYESFRQIKETNSRYIVQYK